MHSLTVRWLQLRDMKGYIEIALSLAAAYLAYYVTQVSWTVVRDDGDKGWTLLGRFCLTLMGG